MMRLEITYFYYCCLLVMLMLIVSGGLVKGAEEALNDRCGKDINKVVACLNFATGKAETPGKECCESASSIEASDRPVCFCYIIEQMHNGSNAQIKSFGIQEARLLQLPSACKINDVNVTSCPKLLNLPPNSPDAAFFTNTSANSGSTTPVVGAGPAPSNAFRHNPLQLAGHFSVAVAIFYFKFWKLF